MLILSRKRTRGILLSILGWATPPTAAAGARSCARCVDIGCTSCIVKCFRSRSPFLSSRLWTPSVFDVTSSTKILSGTEPGLLVWGRPQVDSPCVFHEFINVWSESDSGRARVTHARAALPSGPWTARKSARLGMDGDSSPKLEDCREHPHP